MKPSLFRPQPRGGRACPSGAAIPDGPTRCMDDHASGVLVAGERWLRFYLKSYLKAYLKMAFSSRLPN